MKMLFKLSALMISLSYISFLASCSGGTEEPIVNAEDPLNLVVEILNSDDGTGLVAINASADNTVEYQFYLDDGTDIPVVNTTGKYEHSYENSGTYNIEVRAVGSNQRFIKKEERILVNAGTPVSAGPGYMTPLTYPNMDLEWNDEFDGNSLDLDNWSYDNGDGCPNLCGWGNNELEYYRPENLNIEDGVMTIEARKEAHEGRDYTSTKIVTRDKRAFLYGRVDIRAKMPFGKGIWPALWMLGTNISSVSWPSCGEIDIMEMVGGGGKENITHGTAHFDSPTSPNGGSYTLPSGNLATEFHVYSIIWDESKIEWFLNDISYHTLNTTSSTFDAFRKPFFMIFNVAVGGNWPGNPNNETVFPTSMEVDYVRVFKDK